MLTPPSEQRFASVVYTPDEADLPLSLFSGDAPNIKTLKRGYRIVPPPGIAVGLLMLQLWSWRKDEESSIGTPSVGRSGENFFCDTTAPSGDPTSVAFKGDLLKFSSHA